MYWYSYFRILGQREQGGNYIQKRIPSLPLENKRGREGTCILLAAISQLLLSGLGLFLRRTLASCRTESFRHGSHFSSLLSRQTAQDRILVGPFLVVTAFTFPFRLS